MNSVKSIKMFIMSTLVTLCGTSCHNAAKMQEAAAKFATEVTHDVKGVQNPLSLIAADAKNVPPIRFSSYKSKADSSALVNALNKSEVEVQRVNDCGVLSVDMANNGSGNVKELSVTSKRPHTISQDSRKFDEEGKLRELSSTIDSSSIHNDKRVNAEQLNKYDKQGHLTETSSTKIENNTPGTYNNCRKETLTQTYHNNGRVKSIYHNYKYNEKSGLSYISNDGIQIDNTSCLKFDSNGKLINKSFNSSTGF